MKPGARIHLDPKSAPGLRELVQRRFPNAILLGGRLPPASLAAPGGVTPGSAEPARAPDDHMTPVHHDQP